MKNLKRIETMMLGVNRLFYLDVEGIISVADSFNPNKYATGTDVIHTQAFKSDGKPNVICVLQVNIHVDLQTTESELILSIDSGFGYQLIIKLYWNANEWVQSSIDINVIDISPSEVSYDNLHSIQLECINADLQLPRIVVKDSLNL